MAKFGANCQLLVDCWRDVAVGTVGSQPSLNYTGVRLELPNNVYTFLVVLFKIHFGFWKTRAGNF